MQILSSFEQLASHLNGRATASTIGVFDGVHLGHQALLRETLHTAAAQHCVPLVITFSNHPLSVLAPPYTPRRLLSPSRKADLLLHFGIETVLMLEFTKELAAMPPDQFVRDCLVNLANSRSLVCGYDFTFGNQGAGNLELLNAMGSQLGFTTTTVKAVSQENHPVKSTHVRDLLFGGHVSDAAILLSRPHELQGIVGSGMQRGRTIGFPTANLQVPENYQSPAGGVYICGIRIGMEQEVLAAMVNIGTSPTFGENAQTVEAHILDFNADIHGKQVSLFFIERLRDERRFPGVEALVEQLQKDRQQTLTLWNSEAIRAVAASIPGPVDHYASF